MSSTVSSWPKNRCPGCQVGSTVNSEHQNCCQRCRNFSRADEWAIKNEREVLLPVVLQKFKFSNPDPADVDWRLRVEDAFATNTDKQFIVDRLAGEADRENLYAQIAITLARGEFDSLTDRARALYTWVSRAVRYDRKQMGVVGKEDVIDVLVNGEGICWGIAGLYSAIGNKIALDLEVQDVDGAAKLGADTPPIRQVGNSLYKNVLESTVASHDLKSYQWFTPCNHAWNEVVLESGPLFVDCTWASPNDPQDWKTRSDPTWFAMSTDEFLLTHYPAHDHGKDVKCPDCKKSLYLRLAHELPTWKDWAAAPDCLYLRNTDELAVDRRTVKPQALKAPVRNQAWSPQDETLSFEFEFGCVHQPPPNEYRFFITTYHQSPSGPEKEKKYLQAGKTPETQRRYTVTNIKSSELYITSLEPGKPGFGPNVVLFAEKGGASATVHEFIVWQSYAAPAVMPDGPPESLI